MNLKTEVKLRVASQDTTRSAGIPAGKQVVAPGLRPGLFGELRRKTPISFS
jgi:hypothetical protein